MSRHCLSVRCQARGLAYLINVSVNLVRSGQVDKWEEQLGNTKRSVTFHEKDYRRKHPFGAKLSFESCLPANVTKWTYGGVQRIKDAMGPQVELAEANQFAEGPQQVDHVSLFLSLLRNNWLIIFFTMCACVCVCGMCVLCVCSYRGLIFRYCMKLLTIYCWYLGPTQKLFSF